MLAHANDQPSGVYYESLARELEKVAALVKAHTALDHDFAARLKRIARGLRRDSGSLADVPPEAL